MGAEYPMHDGVLAGFKLLAIDKISNKVYLCRRDR